MLITAMSLASFFEGSADDLFSFFPPYHDALAALTATVFARTQEGGVDGRALITSGTYSCPTKLCQWCLRVHNRGPLLFRGTDRSGDSAGLFAASEHK
jgi:hypothetical protein